MENKVLATVNGKEITQNDIEMAIKRFPQERQAYFQGEEGKKQLLDQLVAFELFHIYGVEKEFDKTEEFIDAVEMMKRDALTQMSVNKVLSEVKVTDKEVEEYYSANKKNFISNETVSAKHILVQTEELAKEIQDKIEGGMSFEEAAMEYSTCPSKAQGGNLGRFSKGQMVPEFEDAAFSLEIGKLSNPVKTQFGYHLIEVIDKQEAAERAFDEVKDMIKANLMQQRQTARYSTFVEELKSKYDVKVK